MVQTFPLLAELEPTSQVGRFLVDCVLCSHLHPVDTPHGQGNILTLVTRVGMFVKKRELGSMVCTTLSYAQAGSPSVPIGWEWEGSPLRKAMRPTKQINCADYWGQRVKRVRAVH